MHGGGFRTHFWILCTRSDLLVTHSSIYSRVPLMWTPKGRAKSVHISEPSTVVDTLSCGHLEHDYIGKINRPDKKCPLRRSVHIGGVSTRGNSTVQCSNRETFRPKILQKPNHIHRLCKMEIYCNFSIFCNSEFFYSAHSKSVSGWKVSFRADCIILII